MGEGLHIFSMWDSLSKAYLCGLSQHLSNVRQDGELVKSWVLFLNSNEGQDGGWLEAMTLKLEASATFEHSQLLPKWANYGLKWVRAIHKCQITNNGSMAKYERPTMNWNRPGFEIIPQRPDLNFKQYHKGQSTWGWDHLHNGPTIS